MTTITGSERAIVLTKASGVIGPLPVGERYEFRSTRADLSLDELRQRAWRALKRDLPNENPMCWKECE
jgi:hypothetical protein